MAIKQYSLAKDGARQLAPGFKVREFRCRDGSDAIMIDQTLVVLLQAIREHFDKAVDSLVFGVAQRQRRGVPRQHHAAAGRQGHRTVDHGIHSSFSASRASTVLRRRAGTSSSVLMPLRIRAA